MARTAALRREDVTASGACAQVEDEEDEHLYHTKGRIRRRNSLCIPRQDRQYAHDEGVQLGHVVAQELGGVLVGDLAVGGDEAGFELDVCLDRD